MTEKHKAKLRNKWRRWLKIIGSDLGDLLTSQDIFNEIQKVFKANKQIQSPTLFYRWMNDNYATRITVGIRRLTDYDRRTISLYRLIQNISENPTALSRAYFVSGYPQWMRDKGSADKDFDQFACRKSKLLSKFKLERDMRRLTNETERLRKFVNKWIAHTDLRQRVQMHKIPNYEDVADALKAVDKIYCKYILLLTRSGARTRKPEIVPDWKEPLRHPWIPDHPV